MVRLQLPQRFGSRLAAGSNASTPGQSRSSSPMRTPDFKPLLLRISVIKVRTLPYELRRITPSPSFLKFSLSFFFFFFTRTHALVTGTNYSLAIARVEILRLKIGAVPVIQYAFHHSAYP